MLEGGKHRLWGLLVRDALLHVRSSGVTNDIVKTFTSILLRWICLIKEQKKISGSSILHHSSTEFSHLNILLDVIL